MFKKFLKATSLICSMAIMIGVSKPVQSHAASTYVKATATVNVRTGASTKYRSIGKLKSGQKVKVLASKSKWYKVQYTSKKTGWAHKNYLKKVTTTSGASVSSTKKVKKYLTVKAYAYTGGGYTSTGTKAKYGTLAVDPRVIPYGTKVYIKELNKVFTAEDCGGAIKGNKVDIYMNSQAACNNWGARTITLQILK
ncbi:3D domain-containing protein [Terrisporobacter sp.]